MAVRTYNPSVRVGNWNEDVQLEEDTLKDFLARKEKGTLLFQKNALLRESILAGSKLSIARDGRVHFGDKVVLLNPGQRDNSRPPTTISINYEPTSGTPSGVSSSPTVSSTARNTFIITSADGSRDGDILKYGQPFHLRTAGSNMFLASDRATFNKCAKKSRHNEVWLEKAPSHLTEWKTSAYDPQSRFELEYCDTGANLKVLITHVKTNQNLNVEDFTLSTFLGKEFEVTSHSQLDSHKAEVESNIWLITMQVPGDCVMDVNAVPASDPPRVPTAEQQQQSLHASPAPPQ